MNVRLMIVSFAALAAVSASPAYAQVNAGDQEVEVRSLRECAENMGYSEMADSDVRYLIRVQCRLERLRSGNGTVSDFQSVSRAIERGRVTFRQLDTSVEELAGFWMQTGGRPAYAGGTILLYPIATRGANVLDQNINILRSPEIDTIASD